MTLQYIYADLPVGKEVGSLCIISSLFLAIFFSTFIPRLSTHFIPSLSLVVLCYSISHSFTLLYPFALHLSLSQLGSVCAERLLPVAPNSVRNRNSHRFLLSRDFFPHACYSYASLLLSSIRFYLPLHGSTRPNKKDHLLRSRDFVASTTVASRTLGSLHASTIHNFVGFHLSPMNRHSFHPSSPTPKHPTITDFPRGALFNTLES